MTKIYNKLKLKQLLEKQLYYKIIIYLKKPMHGTDYKLQLKLILFLNFIFQNKYLVYILFFLEKEFKILCILSQYSKNIQMCAKRLYNGAEGV